MLRRSFALAACAVPGMTLAALAAPSVQIALTAAKTSTLYAAVRTFADDVQQYSEGALTIEPARPENALDDQLVSALSSGSLSLAAVGTASLVRYQPAVSAFGLPFLSAAPGGIAQAARNAAGTALFAKLPESIGVRVIDFLSAAQRDLVMRERPVLSPADASGLKIGIQPGGNHAAAIRALGAVPVEIPPDGFHAALGSAKIDGVEVVPDEIESLALYDVAKYVVTLHVSSPPYVMLAAERWWGGLEPDQRMAVARSAGDAEAFGLTELARVAGKAYAGAQAKGMRVISPDPRPLGGAGDSANLAAWQKEYGPALIDAIFKAVGGT